MIFDIIFKRIQNKYCDRGADQANRDAQVQMLADNMKERMTSEDPWGPICMFAEGAVTNGHALSGPFRRGAFSGNYPVKPCYFKFHYKCVSADFGTIWPRWIAAIMLCEFALNEVETHELPDFIPNDYLYNEYAKTIEGHENMEKWQIYAHAVRDIIATHGGFDVINTQPNRDKVDLMKFMNKIKDEIEINGKKFYWPPARSTVQTSVPEHVKSKSN